LLVIEKTISTVDLHTAGEPVRFILEGLGTIPGKTMVEKQRFFAQELDSIRTLLMHEPRGHRAMCGALLTPPVSRDAQFGLLFFDGEGYLNMCGHGTIGVATAVLEQGMFAKKEPYTHLSFDTPAGLIHVKIQIEMGQIRSVTLRNVASFLFTKDVVLELPGIGEVSVDIAFGGNFFAFVKASALHLEVEKENLDELIAIGLMIRDTINAKIKVQHPIAKHITSVGLTGIYGKPKNPQAQARNVVIFGNGQVDRSPCGTGTSARLAAMYARGQIGLDEPFMCESIIGTLFEGKIVAVTKVGQIEAIIPEIKGSAYVTGFNQFIVDSEDPLKNGFQLW
jgi:proline racemase